MTHNYLSATVYPLSIMIYDDVFFSADWISSVTDDLPTQAHVITTSPRLFDSPFLQALSVSGVFSALAFSLRLRNRYKFLTFKYLYRVYSYLNSIFL